MTTPALEELCMSFKGATRDIKWGNDMCYSVGSKMFCVTSATGKYFISFKTTPEEYAELIEREGVRPAPYSARYYWVLVETMTALRPKEWKEKIQKSYELVVERLPKKARALLG
jgi:predicted DNA-binding protein (MmcQ/YjbR family)